MENVAYDDVVLHMLNLISSTKIARHFDDYDDIMDKQSNKIIATIQYMTNVFDAYNEQQINARNS